MRHKERNWRKPVSFIKFDFNLLSWYIIFFSTKIYWRKMEKQKIGGHRRTPEKKNEKKIKSKPIFISVF